MSLQNRAVLVRLHITAWTGRVQDRPGQATIARVHGSAPQTADTRKRLLTGTELQEIHTLDANLRQTFYRFTLPWSDDYRILANIAYQPMQGAIRPLLDQRMALVNTFADRYNELVLTDRSALGDRFSSSDYPDAADIRSRFHVDVRFRPVPEQGDFRLHGVDEADLAHLRQQLAQEQTQLLQAAGSDAWNRFYEALRHLHHKLQSYGQPGTRIHDTLMPNFRDLCQTLPALNITQDPTLDSLAADALRALDYSTDAVRDSAIVRSQAADRTQRLLDRLQQYVPPTQTQ